MAPATGEEAATSPSPSSPPRTGSAANHALSDMTTVARPIRPFWLAYADEWAAFYGDGVERACYGAVQATRDSRRQARAPYVRSVVLSAVPRRELTRQWHFDHVIDFRAIMAAWRTAFEKAGRAGGAARRGVNVPLLRTCSSRCSRTTSSGRPS